MVKEQRMETFSVMEIDETDDISANQFDRIALNREKAVSFEKYWEARARKFPEKFFWRKVTDPKIFEYYQKLSDERFEKRNNGG